MSKLLKNQFLFCPGPVIVAKSVFEAVSNNIGHREEEFSTLLKKVNKNLLELFEIRKKSLYHPLLITGSGTAANETVLSSAVANKHILILSNGEFGDRLHAISKIHNKNTKFLSFGWGNIMNVDKIEAYIKKHKVDMIGMVHHETSIGILNPVEEVGKLTKKYKKTFYIDTVSSAGADRIDLEGWNVAYCTTSSGKAVGSLPGIGMIIVRKKDVEALKNVPAKTAYLNLYNLYKYSTHHMQTPNTPAVHLFYALDQALTNILNDGIRVRHAEIKRRALYLRETMKSFGLEFLIDERHMSASLTTVKVPSYTSFKALRRRLKEKDIVIYNGKGPFVDRVFQVGNIGELTDDHIEMFLESLKKALYGVNKVKMVKGQFETKTSLRSYFAHFGLSKTLKQAI